MHIAVVVIIVHCVSWWEAVKVWLKLSNSTVPPMGTFGELWLSGGTRRLGHATLETSPWLSVWPAIYAAIADAKMVYGTAVLRSFILHRKVGFGKIESKCSSINNLLQPTAYV